MRVPKLKGSNALRRCHASSLCAFLHNARARHLHDCPPVRAGDLVGHMDVGYQGTSGPFTKLRQHAIDVAFTVNETPAWGSLALRRRADSG